MVSSRWGVLINTLNEDWLGVLEKEKRDNDVRNIWHIEARILIIVFMIMTEVATGGVL